MSDDEYTKGSSGASDTVPAQCSSLRKNGHVMIKEKPCRIVDMSTSKTGKHGHAKVRLVGIDIFTGAKYEMSESSTHNVEVPTVTRKEYEIINVVHNEKQPEDDSIDLMDDEANVRSDIRFDSEKCREKADGSKWTMKDILDEFKKSTGDEEADPKIPVTNEPPTVTVVTACGQEVIKEIKIGKKL